MVLMDAVVVVAFLVGGLLDRSWREGLSREYGLMYSMVLGLVVLRVSVLVRLCVLDLSWLALLFVGVVVVLVDAGVSWLVGG